MLSRLEQDVTVLEEWRPVPSFPGYEASSLGRIKGLRGFVLRTPINANGRRLVSAYRDGLRFNLDVHVAVAEAFLGPRPVGALVRHINDDCLDNQPDNLVYGSRVDNAQDAIRNGRNPFLNRTHCPRGHEYSEENTHVSPTSGHRQCRRCHRDAERRRRASHG